MRRTCWSPWPADRGAAVQPYAGGDPPASSAAVHALSCARLSGGLSGLSPLLRAARSALLQGLRMYRRPASWCLTPLAAFQSTARSPARGCPCRRQNRRRRQARRYPEWRSTRTRAPGHPGPWADRADHACSRDPLAAGVAAAALPFAVALAAARHRDVAAVAQHGASVAALRPAAEAAACARQDASTAQPLRQTR